MFAAFLLALLFTSFLTTAYDKLNLYFASLLACTLQAKICLAFCFLACLSPYACYLPILSTYFVKLAYILSYL